MKKRSFLALVGMVVVAASSPLSWAQNVRDDAKQGFLNAVRNNDVKEVEKTLNAGMDPNVTDQNGQSALIIALQSSALQVADILIAHQGTQVNYLNPNNESALMFAVLKGFLPQAQALIARGAYVNKTGWTPLHYACTQKELSLVELLIGSFAYIDAWSPNHTTPLMMAAQYGTDAQVQFLLESGADPTLKNQLGLNAYDFAIQAQRTKAAEMILQAIRATQPSGW